MRTLYAWAILVAGCATGSGGSGSAPFQGKEAYEARVKALDDLQKTAITGCGAEKWTGKGGFFEVTAGADGKIAARQIAWDSNPEVAKCILDAAAKAQLPPLPGPPVSHIWGVAAPNVELPKPADVPSGDIVAVQGRMSEQGIASCAQRYLPPEMPVDIEVSLFVFGAKPYVINVASSNAKDGDFETCVQQYVGGETMPASPPGGFYITRLKFHVGRSNKADTA